jgi:uncharacterized GH25 family protein
LRALVALLFFAPGAGAFAHEFWMLADRYEAAPGDDIHLELYVGQNFSGEQVGISAPLVAGFRHYTKDEAVDRRGDVPANAPVGSLAVRLAAAGTHLLAMDSQPSAITLPADLFRTYLELEGLQGIMKAREQAGTSSSPGRERFRRNIKTLIQAGGQSDSTYSRRTGQRLEIVSLSDPYTSRVGAPMQFQVFFDARPLSGALVKFWNRAGGALVALSEHTDSQGKLSVALPQPGVWMVSTVHMIPAENSTEFDWDSYWGNLTFALRPARL